MPENPTKSAESILHIYNTSVKSLTEEFIAKCELFDPYYNKTIFHLFHNRKSEGYDRIGIIGLYRDKIGIRTNIIGLEYSHIRSKVIKKHTFSFTAQVNIFFSENNYRVSTPSKVNIVKPYGISLNQEEIDFIVFMEMGRHKLSIKNKKRELEKEDNKKNNIEIERKFLLQNKDWKQYTHFSEEIAQGYLSSVPERTVRIRIKNETGIITVKGKTEGISRKEFEYEIPLEEAQELLKLCEGSPIHKIRHNVVYGDQAWEIDEFKGDNQGLIIAEIELDSEDEEIKLPPWIGKEVSDDTRYFNAHISGKPFKDWE